jgi:hypothetical protein
MTRTHQSSKPFRSSRPLLRSSRPLRIALGGLCALAAGAHACTLATSAQAGSVFDSLFGSPQRPAYAYSDPRADFPARSAPPAIRAETPAQVATPASHGKAFCVRLCDGRYYPIASSASNSTPVQMCSAMCPAAKTKVFHGGDIASATDGGGQRYNRLDQAFAYRKSVVPGCTCNGKDAFGLVGVDVAADPTLRRGDLVATVDGFKPFEGVKAEFAAAPNAPKSAGALDQVSALPAGEKQ